MKKLFFTVALGGLSFLTFPQISPTAISNYNTKKDTTGKQRPKQTQIPISTMTNTTTIPTSTPPNTNMTTTTPTNTDNNYNQSLTLEELNKKVANLEYQLKVLSSRLPYANVAFVTVVADESNLEGATPDHPDRFKSIRIDNPLCNGNPDVKIFAIREMNDRYSISRIQYSSADGYWHIYGSTVSNPGLNPLKYDTWQNGFNQEFSTIKQYDNFEDFIRQGSFVWAFPTIMRKGDAIELIIVKELPNYNPALYNKSTGQ
ncbi:MAG TPA: hypothetical protein VIV35_09680 [Chitinophagaceae bacterium]